MSYSPNICTKNVFGICTNCSLFAKFFLTNSFYLYGLPKFSPTNYSLMWPDNFFPFFFVVAKKNGKKRSGHVSLHQIFPMYGSLLHTWYYCHFNNPSFVIQMLTTGKLEVRNVMMTSYRGITITLTFSNKFIRNIHFHSCREYKTREFPRESTDELIMIYLTNTKYY